MIIDQYADHHAGFLRDMQGWLAGRKMKAREDIVDGIERAPDAFVGPLNRKNFGKRVVRVARDTNRD